MKKITSIFVTLAAAAMALVSCNRNELVPSAQGLHFTINASAPQTRTYLDNQLDGNYKVGWNANDEIAIFIGTIDEKTSKATAVFQNTAGKAERATFEGTAVAAGEGTFVSLYPASKFVKGYKNGTVGVELASTQQPSAESFDPLADILAAPACAYESDGTDVVIDDLYFKRVISVVKVNLKGTFAAGDVVKNFSMTSAGHFGEDGTTVVPDTLTGRASIDLAAQKIVKWNTNSNSVKAIPTEDIIVNDATANAIYLAVNPTTIVAGTEVTFEAETDKHAIKKTVTLSKDLAFPQGNIAVINLTITEADCSVIVDTDYSGDYLMTGTYTKDEVTATYAAKAWVSGNNNLKTAVVTVNEDNTISASDSDHKMTFTKVTTGDYEGMYTIQDANGLYLYAASSSGNQLKGEAEPDVNAYWTVKANEDGTYAISAEKSSNRNVLEFNTNNGSPIISCYSSSDASRQSVKLYPYSAVSVPPVFTVEASGELNVNAAATSAKFAVTANVAWTASLEEAYEGVTIAPASGSASATVTLSFPANTTATAKEYIVYFNADGFQEFEFTVNQAAASQTEELSITQFIALSDNATGTFSGVVAATGKSGVIVTDGVDNIYVFSPTTVPSNGQNVTVSGTKTTYYDFVEVSKDASVTVNSNNNEIIRTAAVDVTSSFDSYPSTVHSSDYIKVTGRLEVSGSYLNLYVDGASARTGSLQTDTGLSVSDYNGKTVDIEGYYLGTSGTGGKYFVILVTSIKEAASSKTPQTLAFNPTLVTLTLGDAFTAPTLTGAKTTVTYASSDAAVAEVNASTGAVTIKAAGNATITATAAEDDTYSKGTASYTIIVHSPAGAGEVTDVITAADLAATNTTYKDFSGVKKESGAVYAGQSAKDSAGNIQLRSKNSNSGIVSTTSGGTVKSVTITVGTGTNTIEIYGSNTAYTSAADLYSTSGNTNQGTKIGSLSSTGTIEFTEDYKYVGIRSTNGAIYLSKIEITWATE